MLRVIIVEDEEKTQKEIKTIVNKALFDYHKTYDIDFYDSYNSVLKETIDNDCDNKIFILDIALKTKISGIDIAKMIREKDWHSHIIFISSHDHQFTKIYTTIYEIFSCIEKFDNMSQRLMTCLEDIINHDLDEEIFQYQNRLCDISIKYSAILYITRDKEERKTIIHTDNNEFLVNIPLQEMLKHLDCRFKFVHRACIANTKRVQKYSWTDKLFVLDNGEKVNLLSKMFRKNVNK